MSDGELLDAREAMSVLGINESDLQTMVARGDLRAFRSAGTMKFRRDDVMGIKTEKKTEPTIIMPPAQGRAKPGSGILPTVASSKSPRGSSRNLPAIKTSVAGGAAPKRTIQPPTVLADQGTSSDQIILEEFELAPSEVDPAANTQQVTAQQTAVSGNVTVADAMDTGGVTVVEEGVTDTDTAAATASAIGAVVATTTASGRTKSPSSRLNEQAMPAMSRVRAAVSSSSQSSVAKRGQATATARSAGPLWTVVLFLTAAIFLFTAMIVGVQVFKGNYDSTTGQRVIPPFLTEGPIPVYTWYYDKLPGNPEDSDGEFKRPSTEWPSKNTK